MPRRNRATPLGELVADPAHGLVFGNRGCLHDEHGTIRRRYAGKRWIACRLEFRGRTRELMQPGRYTELFFLDEATAFAAGHRPCRECRYSDYENFVTIWHEPAGYAVPAARPRGAAVVLTPPTLVGVLHAGWRGDVPLLHSTAGARTTG